MSCQWEDDKQVMTEITESTIKSQSSSTNCDKTGMTGCTSVAFSLNSFSLPMDMLFTLVVLLQAVTTAQAIGKYTLFYIYTAYYY